MQYDLCVLTGDYRGKTFGPLEATLDGLAKVREQLHGSIYGVLGNHDSIQMVPAMEAMGIRMLLNECEPIARGDQLIYLAGIDDAHFYTTSKRLRCRSLMARSPYYCPILRKFIDRPHMPIST